MESLITKAENPPYHSRSQESRSTLQEIREIKESLLGEIPELDRRVDAQINGLARRNQNRREEPQRQRTREGRPICYSCGRVGHVQQNCDQRSPRGTNPNFDCYQPHQQRRLPLDGYPPRSGYQSQRREGLPFLDPRNSNLAAVFEDACQHSHMAPLAHNQGCNALPQSEGKLPGLNSGRIDSQVDSEIFKPRQNVLRFQQEVARKDEVKHNSPTTEFFPALKQHLDDMQQHDQHAYANDKALNTSTADHSGNALRGSLDE